MGSGAAQNPARILVIDDEASMVDACSQLLRREGYGVDSASNGEDGLKKITQFRPDLLIVDLKMPQMSGMELLDHCHNIDETIVCVVITGFATLDSAVEAMKRGAYDFLPKPFSPDALRIIVRRGLERRALIRSASELREAKKLMEENFVTMATHQLKSHIAMIQQYFEVMTSGLTGDLPDAQKEVIGRTLPRLEGLRKIIDDWLFFARINYDEMRDSFRPLNMVSILQKVVALGAPLAQKKEVSVTVEAAENLPMVSGHEVSLEQAFTNLLFNAINYNKRGGSVSVTASSGNGWVVVSVSDSGMGISERDLPFVFEQFFRGRNEQVRSIPGSGLGLSIAKKIMDIHSGRIEVASTPAKGTTFTVRLPEMKQD